MALRAQDGLTRSLARRAISVTGIVQSVGSILPVSATQGDGLDGWYAWLRRSVA